MKKVADFDIRELMSNYIEEMYELLEKFDINIVKLDKRRDDKPLINEVFRVVHSMKGMTSTMGFNHTAELIHAMEDLLYDVRDGKMEVDDKAVDLLLICHDYIENVVAEIAETGEERKDERFGAIIEKLHHIIEQEHAGEKYTGEILELDCGDGDVLKKGLGKGEKIYKIKVFFEKTCMMRSVRGYMVLEALENGGEIVKSVPLKSFFEEGNKYDEDSMGVIYKTKQETETIIRIIKEITEIEYVEVSENIEKDECRIEPQSEAPKQLSNVSELIKNDIREEITAICKEIDEKITVFNVEKRENKLLIFFFKRFHTVRGLGGVADAPLIESIAEATEKYIDGVMKGKFENSIETKELLLNSCDYINILTTTDIIVDDEEIMTLMKNHLANLTKGALGSVQEVSAPKKELPKKNNIDTGAEKIGNILIDQGKLSTDDVVDIIVKQKESGGELKFGEIAVKEKKIEKKELEEALEIQKSKPAQIASGVIKIPVGKVDGLVDTIGELMIIQAQIEQEAAALFMSNHPFFNNITRMSRIIKELQYTSMSMRMVSIQPTFQKLNRIVHDTITELGKNVNVEFEGGETEIDRNIAEKILEPLMHMVRNSISHGIEYSEERIAKGKPEAGNVKIAAYSSKGDVYIEVSDDGQGINTKRVYNKAVEKGLADVAKSYTNDEIVSFIFLPGFSTAETVNNIAGRGVGMDVVKTEVTNIGGKIEIKNNEGKGCSFILKIPINMAAMNGTIIEFLGGKYIIPTVYIKEIVKIEEENWVYIMGKKSKIRLRENIISMVPVEEIFSASENEAKLIIVLENDGRVAALPVAGVAGRAEIVVKPIGEEFAALHFVSGVSILGDGKVSLILDIESILKKI